MKFLLAPTADSLSRSRPPVLLFLGLSATALVAGGLMRALNGGLSPAGVSSYYLGEGEPLGQLALWEEVHVNAFGYGFLLLMLGSLLVVTPLPQTLRRVLLWGGAAAALLDLFLPFLIVASGEGALARVISFLALNGALGGAVAALALFYGKIPRGPGWRSTNG